MRAILARPWTLVVTAILIMTALRVIHLQELDAGSVLFKHPTAVAFEHYHEAKTRSEGNFADSVPRHAPLYTTVLGILFRVADNGDPWVLRLLQSFVGQIVVLLLFVGGRRIIGPWPAATAAALFAIYRPGLLYECEFYAVGIADLLVTAVALGLAACLEKDNPKQNAWTLAIALGLGLGMAAITQTNLLLLTPVVLALFWLGRRSWTQAATVALCAAIPVLVVSLRDHTANDEWTLIHGRTGHDLYAANHAGSDGTIGIRPGPELDAFNRRPRVEANARDTTEESEFYTDRFLEFVRDEPGEFLGLLCRKAWNSLSPVEVPAAYDNESNSEYSRVLGLPLPGFAWLLPLVLVGLIRPGCDRRRHLALVGVLAAIWLCLILGYASGRFRYQAAGLLCLFAASGLHALGQAFKKRERKAMVIGIVAAGVGLSVNALTPRFEEQRTQWRAEYRQLQAYCHLHQRGDVKRARQYAELASRIDPGYAWPHFTLGVISMYGRNRRPFRPGSRPDVAIEHFTQAIQRWPEYPDALQNRGRAYFEKKEYRKAVDDYRATIKLMPYRYQAHTNLGKAYRKLGLSKQARSCERRARKLRVEARNRGNPR
jgi:tetratricopeptide (TPR) repeat protein